MDRIESTGHGLIPDLEFGKGSDSHWKKSDGLPEKNSRPRLNVEGNIPWHQVPEGKISGERTVVLSFRPLQLQRIEALQDLVLKLQVELAATRLANPAGVIAKEKEIDEALNLYG
jgi:hypothetical protein